MATTDQAEDRPLRMVEWPRALWNAIGQRASSSLTRRIVVLNLVGLFALLFGFLYLNQFRQGLIQARVQSLLIQGEIIAGAIASSASASGDTGAIRIDPDKLLQLQAGEAEDAMAPAMISPWISRLCTRAWISPWRNWFR